MRKTATKRKYQNELRSVRLKDEIYKHKYTIEIRLRQNTDTFLSVEFLPITASLETECEYINFMM